MKRYSKRVREEAALICQASASTPGFHSDFNMTIDALGIAAGSRGADLAFQAWLHVSQILRGIDWPVFDAEAEALIRTGWSPPNG